MNQPHSVAESRWRNGKAGTSEEKARHKAITRLYLYAGFVVLITQDLWFIEGCFAGGLDGMK